MGDSYYGEAQITLPEPLPLTIVDKDFDVEVWVDTLLVERFGSITDLGPVKQAEYDGEYERLTELLWEIQSWFEGAEQLDVDEALRTITFGGEHNYGIAFWTENTNLEETCQANGIAYKLSDDGKHEIPGEERMWAPKMADSMTRGHDQSGTVLPASMADAMWDEAGADVAKFGDLVRRYFCPLEVRS